MSERERDRRQLLRLVTGRLDADAARRLRRRAAADPALAPELARLERVWGALDEAPEPPVPPGFSGRVMARVRQEARSPRLSWLAAPTWARAAGAVALVAGLAAGAGLGAGLGGVPAAATSPPDADLEALYDPSVATTLAEDYADALAAFDDGEGEGS